MIYIILTYLFSPLIYLLTIAKKKKPISKILVIQTAKIGDLICSTPVFREVKKKYSHARLSVMINPLNRQLLEYNPNVDEIISLENGFYKGLMGKMLLIKLIYNGRYDIAITLNPNVPFVIAMFWSLIPVRISILPDFKGFTYKIASKFCTYLERHIRGRLVAETYLEMLKFIGIDSKDVAKDVFKSPDADEKIERVLASSLKPQAPSLFIGIAITSGNRLKEWGAENMAFLSDRLIAELGVKIALIGSEKDIDISDKILKNMHHRDAVIDVVGKFSLSVLPALIERLSLLIGVDTGIIYMADALNIPVIDIAGPSDMEDQRPTGEKAIIIQKNFACVPCSHTFKAPYVCSYLNRKCITDITVEEVFEIASLLLSK